jgi:hypothetical protein
MNIEPCILLSAEDYIIYRKITNKNDIENLQKDLDTLGEWAVKNGMKISPSKCKTVRFTKTRFKNPPGYSLGDKNIPEASICKYLGIILQSGLNWVNQLDYSAQEPWKALQFVLRI